MVKRRLIKISITLAVAVFYINISSCSDITNISKEQLKEHSIRIDGPGSKILNGDHEPLYILNDKIFPIDLMGRIKPKYIDSISVLKGDAATQFYGKDEKNVVIKIYAREEIYHDLEPDTTN